MQVINIGITADDGTGDPIRAAFDKCNSNFQEVLEIGAGLDPGALTVEFDEMVAIQSKLSYQRFVPGDYATLELARTDIGAASTTIVVTTPLTEAQSNITAAWPADRALKVEKGGSIGNTTPFAFAEGVSFTAGEYQAFAGSGTVSGLKKARPEWFGLAARDRLTDDTVIAQKSVNASGERSIVDVSSMLINGLAPATNVQVYSAESVRLDLNSQHCYYGSTSGLDAIKAMVQNPLHQHVNIRLIGDSITWGMTTSGMSDTQPRAHLLTDVRNNIGTAPSWANLFRKYIGATYAENGTVIEDSAGSGYYPRDMRTGFDVFGFNFLSESGVAYNPVLTTNTGFLFDRCWDLGTATTDLHTLQFNFTGDGFTLVYSRLTASLSYELFLDGVSQGTFTTSGVVTFSIERTHTFTHGSYLVTIKPVAPDGVNTLRLEGIKISRTFKVSNDGIIGTDTSEWLTTGSLLTSAVTATDSAVICMLGTNDRVSTTVPTAPSKLIDNLKHIHDYVTQTRGIPIVYMSANAVNMDETTATYKFKQTDAHSAIVTAARNLDADVIDHFSAFKKLLGIGCSLLDDHLHPNDLGHMLIFKNLVASLENAPQSRNPLTPSVTSYAVNVYSKQIDYSTVAINTTSVPKTLGIPVGIESILSVCMRCKLVADTTWGDWAFFHNFDTAVGGCRKQVGANYVYAWVDRLQYKTTGATNMLTGFKNDTGLVQDISVEFKVSYIK